MPHSYTRIWVHAVWGTKFRRPYIRPEVEKQIHAYIKAQFTELGCRVKMINGTEDHVHVLFLLCREHSIANIMKLVKANTSRWIRKEKITGKDFEWQEGYGAFSVGPEALDMVSVYIHQQKLHHKKQNFREEYGEMTGTSYL